ncbi:MAG: metal-dependent transcriptional regulator [Anaerolineaceae bacterium]|nr:metal-dependent transcriptional regulator [Anaerolineaceae bacterium]
MTDQIKLSQTIEDYLSLIYVIERDGEPVVGARLAEILQVTPPTVTNTLKRMVRDGLISMTDNGTHLTDHGWDAARQIMRKHMLMEWMMMRMLPWSKLHSEAHNLEHAISEEAENALYESLGHPKTCPHGNPLPGYEDYVAQWLPLTAVPVGKDTTIRRIHELAEENSELLEYLEEKEVLPGKKAKVTEILPFNHTLTIEVNGNLITLGFAVAKRIFVEYKSSDE